MVARGTPTGTMLKNGYQSLVAFTENATLGVWEKEVTPPGLDSGDKIDVTTMHNATYKTFVHQALVEVTDAGMTCAYDPGQLSALITLLTAAASTNQLISYHYPDGSSWDVYGFLKSFTPETLSNGSHPQATVTIVHTNLDNSAVPVEIAPAYNAPSP